jgi:integral membrane protein (TIGR00529 family)
MIELVKLLLVFLLILLLVRRHVPLGLSILAGGFFLGLLCRLSAVQILKNSGMAAIEWPTIHLLIIVLLILVFGDFLKALKSLESLSAGLEGLFRSTRVLLMFLPALVGLLPMPAGAMMSAPMVEHVGSRKNVPADVMMTVNYWFRHVLEFTWPLYLGVVLSASLLHISLRQVILAQIPLSLAMILGGVIFLTPRIKVHTNGNQTPRAWGNSLKLTFVGILPVLAVVGLNLAAGVDIALALLLALIVFGLIKRVRVGRWLQMIKCAMSLEIVMLILAVMIFKKLITVSGAIQTMPDSLAQAGISPIFALSLVPFAVGILTGMTSAFIAISYPVLLSFLAPQGVDYGYMMLAYGAGFMGVMLSPVHLCLVVTKNYFDVSFSRIYKVLLPASLFLMFCAVLLALLGFPWGQLG